MSTVPKLQGKLEKLTSNKQTRFKKLKPVLQKHFKIPVHITEKISVKLK